MYSRLHAGDHSITQGVRLIAWLTSGWHEHRRVSVSRRTSHGQLGAVAPELTSMRSSLRERTVRGAQSHTAHAPVRRSVRLSKSARESSEVASVAGRAGGGPRPRLPLSSFARAQAGPGVLLPVATSSARPSRRSARAGSGGARPGQAKLVARCGQVRLAPSEGPP